MFHDIYMTFLWCCVVSYDVVLYICSIDVTLMRLWFIWLLLIVLFLLLFRLATLVPWKGSIESNLIFHLIRLTFLSSESLELIQKTLNLKDISFHQLLISTKRYLWKFFPHVVHRIHMDSIIFLKSADISNFLGLLL